jgi:probable HAF family extracellular repeat protein
MTDLGTLGGTMSEAAGINDLGQVVGQASLANGYSHAFLWSSGHMTDLGTLGGGFSQADAINNAGQIVGGAYTATWQWHAFVYSAGHMTDITPRGAWLGEATAINNSGDVAGYALTGNGTYESFNYANGTTTVLSQYQRARSINSSGEVVGYYLNSSRLQVAGIRSSPTGAICGLKSMLPSTSWVLTDAAGINDSGDVAATGSNPYTHQTHALLLIP